MFVIVCISNDNGQLDDNLALGGILLRYIVYFDCINIIERQSYQVHQPYWCTYRGSYWTAVNKTIKITILIQTRKM